MQESLCEQQLPVVLAYKLHIWMNFIWDKIITTHKNTPTTNQKHISLHFIKDARISLWKQPSRQVQSWRLAGMQHFLLTSSCTGGSPSPMYTGAKKHKRAVTISPEAHGQWAILYLWTIMLCEERVRRRCWVTVSCSFTTATTTINYCRTHNATLTKKHSWKTSKETHIGLWRV